MSYLVLYDFKGAKTSGISRQFYRALDALMERQKDVKRIQSSVFLCENKASAIELKNMIEGWKANAQLFEIVRPELEPEAIELGEI
jgi:CRISPR/Cas system-associated endoribonuclease Cas2